MKHTAHILFPSAWAIVCFLAFSASPLYSYNQDRNIDSLKLSLSENVKGKDMLSLLDMAAKFATDDLQLALAYSEIALDNAIDRKNYKDVFTIHREKGFFYEDNNQLADALMSYHNALQAAIKTKDENLKLVMYTDLAITHRKLGNYTRAKYYHLKALELAERIEDLEMTEFSYHGLGYLYETIGDYDKAIDFYFKSLEVAETRGSVKGVITTYQNIGLTYIKSSNKEMALASIEKAYQLAIGENDTMRIASVLIDYGEILREVGLFEQALEKSTSALAVYKKFNQKPIIARSLINIADIYTLMGKYELAREYFHESLSFEKYIRSEDKALLQNKLGNLYLKIDKTDDAIESFQNSLNIAKAHNFKKFIQSNNHSLYKIYADKGWYREALDHLITTSQIRDYLMSEDKAKRIAEVQLRYDAEKSEKEIQLLKIRQNKLVLTGSFVIFIFSVIFLIFLIKLKGKNNLALLNKNEEIQTQNIKLKESNEVLNQFTYVAAHDLKEPLRNIGSFINLIQLKFGRQFNQEANEYMGFVTGSVKKLNNLLTDLLEYSRISSQEPKREEADLRMVLKAVLFNLKDEIRKKEATVHFPEHLPPLRICNTHLAHLLQNLISNAIKFTEQKPIVFINAKRVNENVMITVEDNGIGIEEAYGDRIFNLFQQLDKNFSFDGTGIGLTVCKNIVEKYDGEIWFKSIPGKGARFFISLPQISTEVSATKKSPAVDHKLVTS